MSYRIPFNKPGLAGDELRYIADAITQGHSAGDGAYTAKCHAFLEGKLQAARVLLTTSCTHALEMAALLLEIQPGDEVIVPAFTFVSTVNAFVLRGARPVFCDIRPDTLNLDESQAGAGDHAAHQGDRAGALCGRGLRDGRDPGDRRPARGGGGGGQRPRPVRALQRPLPGDLRLPGDAELPRDQEHHLRRRRGAGGQRSGLCGAGGDRARKGHQPRALLSRPGGQVHLGGYRLELPAIGHPGGLPLRAARDATSRSTRSASASGGATTKACGTGRGTTAWSARTCRSTAGSRITCTTFCCARWRTGRR